MTERNPPPVCPLPEECQRAKDAADGAADEAVRKVFAIIGYDVNDPESIENFRKDLRAAGTLRQAAEKGMVTAVGLLATGLVFALWNGITASIGKH